jgi:hypothetical protein
MAAHKGRGSGLGHGVSITWNEFLKFKISKMGKDLPHFKGIALSKYSVSMSFRGSKAARLYKYS